MSGRLTLFAGSGSLVPPVAVAARRSFDDVQVIDLYGRGDIAGGRVANLSIGDGPQIAEALKSFGTTHVALVGAVRLTDRDREGIVSQMGIVGKLARSFGDLGLAGATLLYCRLNGLKLVGAHDVAPELLAPEGHIAGPPVSSANQPAIRLAMAGARAVGAIDLGQAVVFSGERAVAAEDAEGTDVLLRRVAGMRDSGLVGTGTGPLIFAKALKPRQPRFVDLPSVGPQTIINAAAAGISIIALEARQCLLLERPELEREAAERGVSVVGLRRG